MTIAVLAEKPSVARDIARVLGARTRGDGVLTGNGYAVTWAVGHLVALAEPHRIRPEWKRWRKSALPMIPDAWPLEVVARTRDRFQAVKRLLRDPDVREIVCATDAGREGELIFRYIYEAAGVDKPVKRLWVSSLTEEAIRRGFASLRDAREYDGLADAARGRSRADWLVGMNLSRAYTLTGDETFSVGRVQTPTLAMLVEREKAIRDFVPEDYREVVARFALETAPGAGGADGPAQYEGVYFRRTGAGEATRSGAGDARPEDAAEAEALARRLPAEGGEAERIAARARTGRARVESVEARQRRMSPPALYDLTELQRHANRLFGYSAQHTLDVAQSLYESKKLLSYPRTDSRHLSGTVAADLGAVVRAIQEPYAELLAPGTGERPLGPRFVDDARVTDHHAIIPTPKRPNGVSLTRDEARIYDLVCRRLLAAWHPDHVWSTTTVVTAIVSEVVPAIVSEVVPAIVSEVVPGVVSEVVPGVVSEAVSGVVSEVVESGVTDDAAPERESSAPREIVDRYRSLGTTVDREGWKVLDPRPASARPDARGETGDREPRLPSGLAARRAVSVVDARVVDRKTRPPRRFTDSTLLTGMETAGRTLDDKQLSDAMRATGLGTPATRAAIIETLIARGYATRSKKTLVATHKGIALIDRVHPDVRSPRMTGEWEARLQAIRSGQGRLDDFMHGIERYVKDVVQRVVGQEESPMTEKPEPERPRRPRSPARTGPAADAAPEPGPPPGPDQDAWFDPGGLVEGAPGEEPSWVTEPGPSDDGWERVEPARGARPAGGPQQLSLTGPTARTAADEPARRRVRPPPQPVPASELDTLLHDRFGFREFRPHQRAVCTAVTEGHDALLVMPTGAGKSLCYQLPGIARAGTTVVVSPLIALMEDQVVKLQELGFAAERIHSGRKRTESRRVTSDYLAGQLDFLFIAPERLGVQGFPELLARRRPGLVAIDEAHCISQWGHDFRPDYRMLGERLPLLRPTPIIALTATATPLVQRDIVKQLGIPDAELHIHGFRRDNIFIELVELRPGARNDATVELLTKPEHRPAIVYAPTRKKAEDLARALAAHMPAAVYHAGIAAAKRDRVQARFLGGEVDVIVATIAFGMGIDKADVRTVVHTALPASVEGYYQEIGRAGRDGKSSRAVLYHSYADRRTHEWFLDRDYPDANVLRTVQRALGTTPVPRAELHQGLRMDPEIVDKALEKLWIHGGALVDGDDRVARGTDAWEAPYRAQREHKRAQLDEVSRFAENRGCHMLQLVRHFGDQADSGKPCGHCASCRPGDAVALDERPADADEQRIMCQILDALRERDGQSKGRLHRLLFGDGLERKRFEVLLGSLVRGQLVHEQADSFESEGETIHFRRLHLTQDGRRARAADVATLQVPRAGAPAKKRSGARGRASRPATGRTRAIAALEAAEAPKALVEELKRWRSREAKRRRVPAFRILTDRALLGIAREAPRDEESLLAVNGMGPTLVRKYGSEILAITRAS